MTPLPSRSLPALGTGLLLIAVVVGGCLGSTSSAAPDASPDPTADAPSGERRPVIIDTDLDISDIAAVAILLRDPAVAVRAIAVDGTGLVHCEPGLAVTRYLLDQFGVPEIPYGCGRESGDMGARPFPADWRAVADDAYGLDLGSSDAAGPTASAADVIRDAVAASPSAPTIVALGPLTNLQDAFAADPTLPDRIAGIHAMLGTIDAPGNVLVDDFTGDDRLEWNAYADPKAVASVFATDVPISLIPLDATDDVPVPADLPQRLEADHDGAGADLLYEAIARFPDRLAADQGQQLWDELAALTFTDPALVTWADTQVVVGPRGGLTPDDAGRPIRYATSAEPVAVEEALLAALGRGAPRTTPFEFAGTLSAAFDGATCTLATGSTTPGLYRLSYAGLDGTPSGVFLAGIRAPKTWADLEAFVASIDPASQSETPTPDWIVPGAQAFDEDGSGTPITAIVDAATGELGPICLAGAWPNPRFVVGSPIVIGG
jgi:inosine-uridine nucleoside N-ribohydrolase